MKSSYKKFCLSGAIIIVTTLVLRAYVQAMGWG